MVGFLSRWQRNHVVRRPRRVRLAVELLESRDCPSAPQIIDFEAAFVTGQLVNLSGHIAADNPSQVDIGFSGAASGKTSADSTGAFSLEIDANSLGAVYAVATGPDNPSSTLAEADLLSPAPKLTLSAAANSGESVTLAGQVVADDPGGLIVTFNGAASGSVVTNADGSFSFQTQTNYLGTVRAVTQDIWGQVSSPATATLSVAAPMLSVSSGVNADSTITLFGQVTADDPGGLTVIFSGAASGFVFTDPDGTYSYQVQATYLGTVYATTQDVWGQQSNIAQANISVAAPTLCVSAVMNPDATATLSGQVSADNPGGLTVSFNGAVSGSVVTNPDGSFSFQAPASYLGTVEVSTQDIWGQASNTAEVSLSVTAPSLSLTAVMGPDQTVTLSGQVSADNPGGLSVTFSGAATGSVVTNPDGSFSFQTQASCLGTVQAITQDVWGQTSNIAEASLSVAAPTLSLWAVANPDGTATVSGQVNADAPGGLIVIFSGAVSGTVATNPDGSFSVQTPINYSGTIEAFTQDVWGQPSNMALANIASNGGPSLSLSVSYGAGLTITLSGQVADDSPGGLTIVFSGAASGSVVTNPDGTFSLTLQANELGDIQAVVYDSSGAQTDAQVTLSRNPPVITQFMAEQESLQLWTFTGTVSDDSGTAGLVVTFSASKVPSLNGQTAVVNADGTFTLSVLLGTGEGGYVRAQTIDWWGLTSNVVRTYVS
jgi:hypothetical protein